jgi:hypothetical protein
VLTETLLAKKIALLQYRLSSAGKFPKQLGQTGICVAAVGADDGVLWSTMGERCGIAVRRGVCQCAAGGVLWSGVVLCYRERSVLLTLQIVRMTVVCVLLQDVQYHHACSVVTTTLLSV